MPHATLLRFAALLLFLVTAPLAARAQPDWNPDSNGDGEVGTRDLLDLLSVFGGGYAVEEPSDLADPCAGQTVLRHHRHSYALVPIGGQCWFAENLRATAYANGDPIPSGLSASDWLSAKSGARAAYGEGDSRVYAGLDDPSANLAAFGWLYNSWAVADPRGLCPAGWRVPSAEDWAELVDACGGPCSAGKVLQPHPTSDAAFSSTGFNALPGGGRNYGGFFGSGGEAGLFWSTDRIDRQVWYFRLEPGNPASGGGWTNRGMGASIRCLKG